MKDSGTVIVAAGLSSRMQKFKPMLSLGESSLIRHAIRTLLDGGIGDIVVVTGNKAPLLEEHLAGLPVRCAFNPDFATCEMIDSARLGFANIVPECKRIFFLPCDVPLFMPQTLSSLIAAMKEKCAAVVKPVCQGQPGHPILLDSSLLPHIAAYTGGGGLAGALRAYGKPVVHMECQDPGILMDADTPEDYEKLLDYYEKTYAQT